MKKICKNCSLWYAKGDDFGYKDNHGYCDSDKFMYGGEWDSEVTDEYLKKNDGLIYEDCEGYAASFETGENFGCIHFKEKE